MGHRAQRGFGEASKLKAREILHDYLGPIRTRFNSLTLPAAAKAERRRDSLGLPEHDMGVDRAIDEGVAWLKRAQDQSTSHDGGVARHYSLVTGWSASYPETTGYIVPTMLNHARATGDQRIRQRARRMLEWFVSTQLPEGGFQGGLIDCNPVVPVTFNTGQILLGLAAGANEFEDSCYHEAMCRAADWLVETQDSDGCWRKHPTPFAKPGEKAYETHVARGLFEAARIQPDRRYAESAVANIKWALTLQHQNGWFEKCCLTDQSQPLTHTLGYALRGIIEAYGFTKDAKLLDASRKTADGLLKAIRFEDGFLPGRLDENWNGTVSWSCLTGSLQIALCWLKLFQETANTRYRNAAYAANQYVRRTVSINGPPGVPGGVKGSFPVDGGYGTYEYLAWACKFFVASNLLEKEIRKTQGPDLT